MKKILISLLALMMALTSVAAMAENMGNDVEWRAQLSDAGKGIYVEGLSDEEIAALTETTIIKDENSPTGYTVTFRHYAPDATRVRIRGEWSLYQPTRNSTFVTGPYDPEEWVDGMVPVQVDLADWPAYDMEKNEETGVWYHTIPLYSGTWSYRFYEGGVEGAELTDYTDAVATTDVNNRPFEKELGEQGNSQVRVPYDAEKQTQDFSVQLARTDDKVGITEVLTYEATGVEDLKGDPAIAVYLPYGYDAEREEPYKTLYISHGGGAESETSWYNKGSLANITDNLMAEGIVEPMVVVILNNFAVNFSEDSLINDVLPLVESTYNVSTDVANKAVCGLSAGSMFTSRVMQKYPEAFGTYGRFSAEQPSEYPESIGNANLYVSAGYYDFAFGEMLALEEQFEDMGFEYDSFYAFGGHDWNTWRQIYVDFLSNFLWK